jgi:predicted dithiol-disulfide oxidoreductase (DUF899 family)
MSVLAVAVRPATQLGRYKTTVGWLVGWFVIYPGPFAKRYVGYDY